MVGMKLAAASLALLPAAADAFVAPTVLRGQVAQTAGQAAAASAAPSGGRSTGVATVAACALVATVAVKAARPARKSAAASSVVSMQAEEEVKMSPSVPYLPYPERLEGWVGGEKGFDPLRTSDIIDVYWLREAVDKRAPTITMRGRAEARPHLHVGHPWLDLSGCWLALRGRDVPGCQRHQRTQQDGRDGRHAADVVHCWRV
ncbi:Light-harvesting complex-like [Amphidinium carterae]